MLGGAGALSITERSRCDADGFPLGYESTDGGYWRECHRRRDPAPAPHPWTDFAQWSCGGVGACSVALPPAGTATDPTQAPPHGLCELGAGASWGTEWRGMHHHSQFRCVLVDDASTADHAVGRTSIYDVASVSGTLSFQRCSANDAGASAPFACTLQPRPAAGATAQVGWAAVRYEAGAALGCIDESAEPHLTSTWGEELCPDAGPVEFYAYGEADDFGRLGCGCDAPVTYVLDADEDGFGVAAGATTRCAPPAAGEGNYIEQRSDGRFDCDDTNRLRNPGQSDVPDLAALDANCDDIDGDESALLFVDPDSTDASDGDFDPTRPGSPGTRSAPFRTLRHAIEQAARHDRDLALRATRHSSVQTIELSDGVSLYGGYSDDFMTRSTSDRSATSIVVAAVQNVSLSGVPGLGSTVIRVNVAIDASDVHNSTTLQLLTVRADTAPVSSGEAISYYGIRGAGTSNLTLDHVLVEAADAGAGASTSAPGAAAAGYAGSSGGGGNCFTHSAGGGGGGGSPCGGSGGGGGSGTDGDSGGRGGNGVGGRRGATAALGGATGGAGGSGGSGGGEESGGGNGADGAPGQDGGAPGSSALVHGGYWIPRRGWPGAEGGAGGGAGGGGGGDGYHIHSDWVPDIHESGGGGGGGGGGGCGGAGGGGGMGGGGSFAAFFTSSAGIVVRDSMLRAGSGGRGGNGAAGASGASGGGGGSGGGAPCRGDDGAGGGTGGRGGDGGDGAGGAGGDSAAIFGVAASSLERSSLVCGAAGLGGSGGSSLNGGPAGVVHCPPM
jgi:hypothetical protein